MHRPALPALLALLALAACSKAPIGSAPHQIHIAGSSVGYLLSTEVAERLMREEPDVLAPLVRAGGTGEGIARFCDKDNPTRPDILLTTRTMTPAEQARCAANGSDGVSQRPIGSTGVLLVAAKDGPSFSGLSRADLVGALTGRAKTWAALRPGLPAAPVVIHGPAPDPSIADTLYGPILSDGQKVRRDGAYMGHGADAGLIARAVAQQPGALGIVPLAALARRTDLRRVPLTDAGGAIGMRLFLLDRPNDIAHVPGLKKLLGYYDDALSRARAGISPGRTPPPITPDAKL